MSTFEPSSFAYAADYVQGTSTRRTLWKRDPTTGQAAPAETPTEVQMIGSIVRSDDEDERRHAPIFDLDYHAVIVPSSSAGHCHLYIERLISWRQYKKVMKAMVKAGLIEDGWYRAAKRERCAYLRSPTVVKPGMTPKAQVADVEQAFNQLQEDLADRGLRGLLEGLRAIADSHRVSGDPLDPARLIRMIDLAMVAAGVDPPRDLDSPRSVGKSYWKNPGY